MFLNFIKGSIQIKNVANQYNLQMMRVFTTINETAGRMYSFFERISRTKKLLKTLLTYPGKEQSRIGMPTFNRYGYRNGDAKDPRG